MTSMHERRECQAYITHISAEHRRLRQLLLDAQSAIAKSYELKEHESFEEIRRILGMIRKELLHHFGEEEEGGCMDEAVSRLPRLSAEAQRIEAEHPDILHQLDKLIDMANRARGRQVINTGIEALYQRILAHEAAENRLLSKGFSLVVESEEELEF